jgi:hypothetical protein
MFCDRMLRRAGEVCLAAKVEKDITVLCSRSSQSCIDLVDICFCDGC